MRPQVFELTGYPGAGKSHAGGRLTDGGAWAFMDGVSATDPRRRTVDRVLLSVRFPLETLCLYGLLLSRHGATGQTLRMAVTIQRRLAFIASLRSQADRVLLDEGVVHGLFSVLYGTRPGSLSRWFLDSLIGLVGTRLTGFVHLAVGRSDCLANLRSRAPGRSRFHAAMSSLEEAALQADAVYDELLASISRRWPEKLRVVGDAAELRAFLGAPDPGGA